jgi:two-component system, OmpR family, response regulator RstA
MFTIKSPNVDAQMLDDAPLKAPATILLVDDDRELARLIGEYLGNNGIRVLVEGRGDRVLKRVNEDRPDLVILDVMLPGKDGFEACRELRNAGNRLPILMLTAREEDYDEVLGLELGADDYLAKPVKPRVLLAHIKALLRRTSEDKLASDPHRLQFGALQIDHASREVRLAGEIVDLSAAEFDLLWLLATHAGKILGRQEILKSLRGLEYDGTDRSIDVRVSRLRRKLGDDVSPVAKIKTVRPQGYMFSPAAW